MENIFTFSLGELNYIQNVFLNGFHTFPYMLMVLSLKRVLAGVHN